MPRIFPIIKKVVTVAGGAVSNRVLVKPAVALSTRLSLLAVVIRPAVRVTYAILLRVPAKPAVLVTQRASGTLRHTTLPALRQTTRAALAITPEKPALDLAQIKYDLTQTKGANAQVGTGTAWSNPGNALGRRDGAIASMSGSALAAVDGTLTFDYANHVSKTPLTILTVTLKFHVSQNVTAGGLLGETMTLRWGLGAATTLLETFLPAAGSFNALTVPKSYDITASIASWADIDSLKTSVQWSAAILSAGSGSIDSVECIVTASVTDAI